MNYEAKGRFYTLKEKAEALEIKIKKKNGGLNDS